MENEKRSSGWPTVLALVAGIAVLALMWSKWRAAVNAIDHPAVAETRLLHGRALYIQNCRCCHGEEAHGDGPAAIMLDPRPRDFNLGKFRLITTASGVPTRDNLIHTIRNGMAG